MKEILLSLYCAFFIFTTGLSQSGLPSHVQEFTTENGMPSNGIKGLQWDERTNFLWIATEAGIVRFNGVDLRSYTKENMASIASERMLLMVRNNAGAIYISDLSGNLFSIDKNKPVLWKKAEKDATPYFGNYYLLGVSDQFFNATIHAASKLNFSSVSDKIVCQSDTGYFILHLGTLYHQNISEKEPELILKEQGKIKSIFKIGETVFILNGNNEYFRYDHNLHSLTSVKVVDDNGNKFRGAYTSLAPYWETGMNSPILIEQGNAWEFSYENKNIKARLIFRGIPSDALIRSIQYSSKNNTLFLGTDSKGLIVLNLPKVESMKRANANSGNRNSYYSQIELSDGNVLTNEGDIIGKVSSSNSTVPIQGKFTFNISQTNDSLLWYNQNEPMLGLTCLHCYNKITGKTKVYGKIVGDGVVTSSGTSFYVANPRAFGIIEGDSLHILYQYPPRQTGNITFDFQEISPGILGIATCGGLFRYNTHTSRFDTLFSKENICVRNIWKYKDYVFFGTYGSGFYIYKDGKIKAMPVDKNKYLLYTHCFIPDDNGYCWISTNRGLFMASLAELTEVFEKNSATVYYHYFGKKDGMEMTELNGGCTPCALRLRNKTISFPTMDGLLWVSPEKAVPVLPDGEIFIDEILVDNKVTDLQNFIQQPLPPKTGEIVIRLAFSAWCNKENIYLEYQLNDTVNWKPVTLGNESEIHFNNLPSGKYQLRIRKLNGFGYNNYTYKEIQFSITTPWYKQWWFYFFIALSTAALILIYLRIRTNQYRARQQKLEKQVAEKTRELQEQNEILEKNNSIKTRLISIISHDIVTPLKFVTVAGKNLIEKRSLMSEELQQETIREMTNTSQELQLLSTNILNWIKYQNENRRLAKEQINPHEIINQILGILNSLAKQKNLTLINEVDPELSIYQYFEPLKILIYNLLTNAINFSENGNIHIAAKTATDTVVISVSDEGVGMTPDQIKNIMANQFIVSSANMDNRKGNGLGYLIIKDLVKMMGATLSIKSEKGKGTIVSVQLPVNKNN